MTQYKTLEYTLGTAVADDATVEIAYPSGSVQGDFTGVNAATTAYLILNDNDRYTEAADEFDISYGASTVTITNKTGFTWPIGTTLAIGLAAGAAATSLTTLLGSLTGTIDGTIADVAAVAISSSGGNTYADSTVNTAVNVAVTSINLQLKELQAKVNAIIDHLETHY